MKRKFVQIAASCLAAALLLASGGGKASAAPAGPSDRIIRVGLHHDGSYGTGSLEGVNLQNVMGSGFRFGYYDASNRFIELGWTGETKISLAETMNVYYGTYGGYTSYHTAAVSSVAVGEYHLQLPGIYGTFAEAYAAASPYPGGFAAYIGGAYYARVGNYTTSDQARAVLASLGIAAELCWTSEYGVNAVITGTNTILFQYDDLGQGTGLGVEPISVSGEKCVTWCKYYQYNGGFRFERINGGKLTVVNMVGLEDYVKGVLPYEMSDSWPLEALKAQAVAARSYTLSLGTKHSAQHFDICDNTDCQVYQGRNKAGAATDAATDQTAGQVALCDGKPIQAFFYSSNGGASESVSNVWGSNQSLYPYLVGKADPYEPTLGLKNYWERSFTSAQIVSRLLAGKNVTAPLVSAEVTAYTDVGNPRLITFTDSAGKNFSVSTVSVLRSLALPSFRFGFAGSGTSQPAPATPSAGVSINGAAAVDGTSGLCAIDGNGNVTILGGGVYVIADGGTPQQLDLDQSGGQGQSSGYASDEWSGSGRFVNGSITFAGRGSGHNIGLSQFGAKAMAEQGRGYLEILQFYYTGITVGYM